MALVPYTITALAESDAQGTDGKNIVAGATCSMYSQPSDSVVTLYDDAAGSNGSTSKVTGANGQVVVYVEPGSYRVSVNAVDSYTLVGAEVTDLRYDNVAEMITNSVDAGKTINLNRYYSGGDLVDGLEYYIKTSAQASADGDVADGFINHTLVNGNVAILQIGYTLQSSQCGGKNDSGSTDNTAIIQSMVTRLESTGIDGVIEYGCSFSLYALSIPNRVQFYYYEDDNTDAADVIIGSNELVKFLNNGNVNGAVNEDKLAAGFHPAYIINAIPSQSPTNRGAGQDLGNPRSSILHQVDGRDYIQHGINEDGHWVLNKFNSEFQLNGVRIDLFAPSAILVGDTVTGVTSGAVGIVTASGASDLTVAIRTGVFLDGENLASGGNTSTTTITSSVRSIKSKAFAMIMKNYTQGVGFSVQPDDIGLNHTIGGGVQIGPQTAGGASQLPSIKMVDSHTSPTNGIILDLEPASSTVTQIKNKDGVVKAILDFLTSAIFKIPIIRANDVAAARLTIADDGYDPIAGTPAVTASTPYIRSGTGTPESVVAAPIGAVYINKSGGSGTTLYIKESGAGSTGWVAK